MMTPEEMYKYDNTFRRIVDLMRHELNAYDITPAELRQAIMLAATMHECEHIKPLFIPIRDMMYPAMFGIMAPDPRTVFYTGPELGMLPSDRLNYPSCECTKHLGEKPEHCHCFTHMKGNVHQGFYCVCNCGISDIYYEYITKKS